MKRNLFTKILGFGTLGLFVPKMAQITPEPTNEDTTSRAMKQFLEQLPIMKNYTLIGGEKRDCHNYNPALHYEVFIMDYETGEYKKRHDIMFDTLYENKEGDLLFLRERWYREKREFWSSHVVFAIPSCVRHWKLMPVNEAAIKMGFGRVYFGHWAMNFLHKESNNVYLKQLYEARGFGFLTS